MTTYLEADYLVVGAGAMGMAFVDTLLTETDATIVMVDRHHQPGGHWNMAYPFVRLHQPSSGYGVNSRHLGSDALDLSGWNKGLLELATSGEVCAYFSQVMQQTLLPSGRVRYFPMSRHDGEGRFHSTVSGESFSVTVRNKTVDTTHQGVSAPSMRPPDYAVAEGATCIPPNALVDLREPFASYAVIGGGKTGIDSCLWLLSQGVDPKAIQWIRPREAWLHNRAGAQPSPLFAELSSRIGLGMVQAVMTASSIDDLFERLEDCGYVSRINTGLRPTMYRCATVSMLELEHLRRITNVVRLGHVQRITTDAIHLDAGTAPTTKRTLHIDCTADGLARRPATPIFDGANITLQSVRTCQQVFSAALIAFVEARFSDEGEKNALCVPAPHPNRDVDLLWNIIANSKNTLRWSQEPLVETFVEQSRLDWLGKLGVAGPRDAAAKAAARQAEHDVAEMMIPKLETLLSS